MANKNRGEVSIEIGGATRLLRLDFNAIADLEEMRGGTPIQALFNESRIGIGVVRDALFCALRHADRRLTPKEVGRWMGAEPQRISEWAEALGEAANHAMGVAPDPQVPPSAPAPVTVTSAPVEKPEGPGGPTTTS